MAYLASVLLEEGHSVKILDMEAVKMQWNDLPAYLKRENPGLVGIHGTTPISHCIAQCVEIAKDTCPHAKVVVGGPHATLLPREVLASMPQVDYILRGEAEFTMKALVEKLEQAGTVCDATEIPGIGFRLGDKLLVSPQIPRIENLDSLPLPAYDLLPMHCYFETGTEGRIFTMMSSRGCPHNCIFCCEPVLYGRKYRTRSPQSVVDEMRVLSETFGIDHIIFYDAEFTANAGRVERICQSIIENSVDLSWRVRARADSVDARLMKMMKSAGCSSISFGVETRSQRLLDTLNKRCNFSISPASVGPQQARLLFSQGPISVPHAIRRGY